MHGCSAHLREARHPFAAGNERNGGDDGRGKVVRGGEVEIFAATFMNAAGDRAEFRNK